MKDIFFLLLISMIWGILGNLNQVPAQQPEEKVEQKVEKENLATNSPVVHEVSMLHVFLPQVLVIQVGDSVRWINNHGIEHNAKSETKTEEGLSAFVSGQLMPNNSYTVQFTKPGTYDYVCAVHPAMKGIVIVKPRP